MPKVRVYELAKELGVESKTVLSMLKDMGEFVRSASSTVEAPVERRLKEKLASEPPPATKTAKASAADGCGRAGCSRPQRRPTATPSAPDAARCRPAAAPAAPVEAPPPAHGWSPHRPCGRVPTAAASARPGSDRAGGTGRTPAPGARTPEPSRSVRRAPGPRFPGPPARCPPAARTGEPARNGEAAPGNGQAPAPPRPRPGSTGGLPGSGAPGNRRTGAPRPGNNPFSPSQGMGRSPAPRTAPADPPRPGGPRPPAGAGPRRPAAVRECRACPGPTRR